MPTIQDLRRQVDHLDRQIVEFLARRTALVRQVMRHLDDEDEEQPTNERGQQVLSNWLEEGFDYDLDEPALTKVCTAVMELGRKSKER